ncbi:MAG: tetratricopeptide repeat protein [Leptonema sp. (in: bacteria)]
MAIFFVFFLLLFLNCSDLQHSLQNWGERYRKERQVKIDEEDIKKWMHELKISEKESKELFTLIEKYAIEKKFQGELSWKIAKALTKQNSLEIAQDFFLNSFENKLEEPTNKKIYESALVYYEKALKYYTPVPDLLFDAAICYGNASSALGWEEERFRTAVFLLERGRRIKPNDIRFPYTLAILLGKTTNQFKDIEKALELLDSVIKQDKYNIPSYFAKAHILVENGDFKESFSVYEEITRIIEEMYKMNLLKGDYTKNRKYLKAQENMKLLIPCIEGRKECQIKVEPE